MPTYTRPAGLENAIIWYDSGAGQLVTENNVVGFLYDNKGDSTGFIINDSNYILDLDLANGFELPNNTRLKDSTNITFANIPPDRYSWTLKYDAGVKIEGLSTRSGTTPGTTYNFTSVLDSSIGVVGDPPSDVQPSIFMSFFKPDGTKVYLGAGSSNHTPNIGIYQYSLEEPFNLDTVSYDSKSFNPMTSTDLTYTSGTKQFWIINGGTSMYIGSTVSATFRIHQYTLSTPWDVSTASFTRTLAPTNISNDNGNYFKLSYDGTKLYICDGHSTNKTIDQHTLSTPYDLSTASYSTQTTSATNNLLNEIGTGFLETFDINSTGTKFIVCDTNGDSVSEYSISTAWDLSSTITRLSGDLGTGNGINGNWCGGQYVGDSVAADRELMLNAAIGNQKTFYNYSLGKSHAIKFPSSVQGDTFFQPTSQNATISIKFDTWDGGTTVFKSTTTLLSSNL